MNCLANDIFNSNFKEKMQNLIWDDILRDTDEWEKFCRDKAGVTDFLTNPKLSLILITS